MKEKKKKFNRCMIHDDQDIGDRKAGDQSRARRRRAEKL